MPASPTAFQDILGALTKQARASFSDAVGDINQHVIPTMATIAHNLVLIGGRLADKTYTKNIADVEVDAQIYAAASVIVGFTNKILMEVQEILNAVLNAVSIVVNRALGVALL
jgi:hypothetical protein